MKSILIAIVAIVFMACKSGSSEAEKNAAAKQKTDSAVYAAKHAGIDDRGLAIEQKDPYCGMPITAGIIDTGTVNRKLYGFCSKECKDEFFKELASKK